MNSFDKLVGNQRTASALEIPVGIGPQDEQTPQLSRQLVIFVQIAENYTTNFAEIDTHYSFEAGDELPTLVISLYKRLSIR
jgi:hypothetical protein